jgi:hypothetical protein
VSGQPKLQRSVGRSVGRSRGREVGRRGHWAQGVGWLAKPESRGSGEPEVVGRKECPKARSGAREAQSRQCQHGKERSTLNPILVAVVRVPINPR